MRLCNLCKEEKPLEQFNVNKKGKEGRYSYCKACHKFARKAHKGKKKTKFDYYMKHYGVSEYQIKAQLEAQHNCCMICSIEINWKDGKNSNHAACVDHDHVTDKVRSILCNHCNRGLGMFRDNVDNIRRAADYLVWHGK